MFNSLFITIERNNNEYYIHARTDNKETMYCTNARVFDAIIRAVNRTMKVKSEKFNKLTISCVKQDTNYTIDITHDNIKEPQATIAENEMKVLYEIISSALNLFVPKGKIKAC